MTVEFTAVQVGDIFIYYTEDEPRDSDFSGTYYSEEEVNDDYTHNSIVDEDYIRREDLYDEYYSNEDYYDLEQKRDEAVALLERLNDLGDELYDEVVTMDGQLVKVKSDELEAALRDLKEYLDG